MQAQKSKEKKKIKSGYGDKGARTPSEPFQGTLKQGTEPTDAHIGSWYELATHPGTDLPSSIVSPPCERDKAL